MFAIILFALFGILTGVVGGIAYTFTHSTQMLNALLRADQARTLSDLKELVQVISADALDVPGTAGNPGPAVWLCNPANGTVSLTKRVISCQSGTNLALDEWHRPLQGVMVRQTGVGMYAKPGMAGTAPVVAMAIISSGPNGVLDTALPTNPTTLAQVTGITIAGDDIGTTFSNQLTQSKAWQNIITQAQILGQIAGRYYYDKSIAFQKTISSSDVSGSLNISEEDIQGWKRLPGAPNFTDIMNPQGSTASNIDDNKIGATQYRNDVERTLVNASNGAGHFNLVATVSSSGIAGTGQEKDTLLLTLTQTSTGWSTGVPQCNGANPTSCIVIKGGY